LAVCTQRGAVRMNRPAIESWLVIQKNEPDSKWSLAAWVNTEDEAEKMAGKIWSWGAEETAIVRANGLSMKLAMENLERFGS